MNCLIEDKIKEIMCLNLLLLVMPCHAVLAFNLGSDTLGV
jgi:hypothetical protein